MLRASKVLQKSTKQTGKRLLSGDKCRYATPWTVSSLYVADYLVVLNNQIQTRNQTWPNEQPKPENNVAQRMSLFHPSRLHERSERKLRQLECKEVTSDLVEDAKHKDLMNDCAQQECEKRSLHLRQMKERDRRVVDMA